MKKVTFLLKNIYTIFEMINNTHSEVEVLKKRRFAHFLCQVDNLYKRKKNNGMNYLEEVSGPSVNESFMDIRDKILSEKNFLMRYLKKSMH